MHIGMIYGYNVGIGYLINYSVIYNHMGALTEQAKSTFAEAERYLGILEKSLNRKSKFTNDLLYNIVSMCTEKLFMAFLSHFHYNATHHTPMALFNETNKIRKLPDEFRETIRLIAGFESICQFDAFGYKTPADAEIRKMTTGLIAIRDYINEIINQVPKEMI